MYSSTDLRPMSPNGCNGASNSTKSKVEPQYGAAKTSLEQAAKDGFPVDAELRFMEFNGELSLKKPEEILMGDLKFQPVYDLKQGKAIAR